MYTISNQQQTEIIMLLNELKKLNVTDNKTANIKRRSLIMTKRLEKSKQVSRLGIKK